MHRTILSMVLCAACAPLAGDEATTSTAGDAGVAAVVAAAESGVGDAAGIDDAADAPAGGGAVHAHAMHASGHAADGDDTDVAAPDDDEASVVALDGFLYFVAPLRELDLRPERDRGDGVPAAGPSAVLADVDPYRSGSVFGDVLRNDPLAGLGVLLDGPGEALVAPELPELRWRRPQPEGARLALRLAEARDVTGRVLVPNADGTGLVGVEFLVPATDLTPDARADWLEARADVAAAHLDAHHTGAAFWRHERAAALAELGRAAPERAERVGVLRDEEIGSLGREFSLVSGGRALSENLALDRLLPFADDAEATVPIDTIDGVSVNAYDWTDAVAGLDPARDALAAFVPDDQHAVFFPSFSALVQVSDELDTLAAPLGRQVELRSEDAETRGRYERQLGLPLSDLARLLGPLLVRSVAITGGDYALRTGSDVALLFEPSEETALRAALAARIELAVGDAPDVARVEGDVLGVGWTGWRSADRSVSSYLAALDGAVVVTNSLAQLERLVRAARGEVASLDETPEYVFFRDRYRLGDPDESALVVLSDATIRRWCGPRVRIGNSRRARAAAVLAETSARLLADPSLPDVDGPLPAPDDLPSAGALSLAHGRVLSDAYGSLAFLTPTLELDLDLVTDDEAALYIRWRQGYEANWRRAFDPIALRLTARDGRLALDVTVRPLVADSEYARFVDLTRGGHVEPDAGDLHAGTLVQYVSAIDSKALSSLPETGMLKTLFPQLDLFGWIGGSFSLAIDDSPVWDALLAADDEDEFFEEHLGELPVALQVEVAHGLKLAAFLTAVRAMVESSAPDTTRWTNREHAGRTYVRVEEREPRGMFDVALHYTTSPEQYTISPSEALVQRVIDRQVARDAARAAGEDPPPTGQPPWIGDHLGLRVDLPRVLARTPFLTEAAHDALRRASWANLPVLDAWHALHPDEDPVLVHERVFARRPVCPGGGEYVWNEAWHTMESTVYGHPGAPREGRELPAFADRLGLLRAGVTFEADGLRARVDLGLRDRDPSGDG